MSWEHDTVNALKKANAKSDMSAPFYLATVLSVSPFTLSMLGGSVLAPPAPIVMTQTASSLTWQPGDRAAVILSGSVLVIDKVV